MIPLEYARELVNTLQGGRVGNLFAQAHAKYVLHEVGEDPENFPAFDMALEDKVTFAAYALLGAGCSLIEQESRSDGRAALERAATLLQAAHEPLAPDSRTSAFNVLIAAMSFYAAGQYSRAFVHMRRVESYTPIASMIASFVRKEIETLIQQVSTVLLRDIPEFESPAELDDWVITFAVARSLSFVLEYISTGDEALVESARATLNDALSIAIAGSSPAHWWSIRLLRLMFSNLEGASLWNTLPPFINPDTQGRLSDYIQLLAFAKRPIFELWTSQLQALPIALDKTSHGGIINLRTSAGKTRVAELAILQTLIADPQATVIYLAPFRSLAFEVERSLSSIFDWLGYQVSHLYGGARVSSVDNSLMTEASIVIATPEKARALFRASPELFAKVKLIVVDEGHLVGMSERYVRNELFVDHIRVVARGTNARMLLLSAVLPNPGELASWLVGNENAVATSSWKPSAERFGLLRWNGSQVRIDWLGEVASFNPSFVTARPTSSRKNSRLFPKNKNEAVAATAARLSKHGPVMIFAGQARWVNSMARNVLAAFGNEPEPHAWPEHQWKVFTAVCEEELGPNALEMRAARHGIICHSNLLTPQVRLASEVLMRSRPPRVIIATTTLGQGVNIGVSSIIFATPYIGQNHSIDRKDFSNIAGRAGRAFVDSEGKILFAIDETRKQWRIDNDRRLAKKYFETASTERVESGLLAVINELGRIAREAGVSFDLLVELVAENDLALLGEQTSQIESLFDLLDDALIALHEDDRVNPTAFDSVSWVDSVFRSSLAGIQARSAGNQVDTDGVVRILRARVVSTLARVPERTTRKAVAASGLPLSVALRAYHDLDHFRLLVDELQQSAGTLTDLDRAVNRIESWARQNAQTIVQDMPDESILSTIRQAWLGGVRLRALSEKVPAASRICKDLYGFQLPWLVNAIAHKFDKSSEEERVKIMSRTALLVELGVPTELAANIFLAGIRSRVAATELSLLESIFPIGASVSAIRRILRNDAAIELIAPQVSESTRGWLSLVHSSQVNRTLPMPEIGPLTLPNLVNVDQLHARRFDNEVYLISLNGEETVRVTEESEAMALSRIANNPRFVFIKREDKQWRLATRDPRHRWSTWP